jgi:hypothetical protein
MNLRQLGIFSIFTLLTALACTSDDTGKGTASFYLTDGPVEGDNVAAVTITFNSVEVSGPDGWQTIKAYEEPQSINLLALQGGETFFIDEAELTSGAYGQVRLGLVANTDESTPDANYITYDDSTRQILKVPSGTQSGYKITGGFSIPDGGVTAVTIDFDIRKSVVEAGASGQFILKPTLRLVENNNAAQIEGELVNYDNADNLVVYAYADDTYDVSEIEENEDGLIFANAVTSANVNDEGLFTLSFLEAGKYDLYVASYNVDGNLLEISATKEDVELIGGDNLSISVEL